MIRSLLLSVILLSCSRFQREGDFFFVRNKGADLPVWVRGNVDSEVFVVVLAGGPGGSGVSYVAADAVKGLETHYAAVYWDQRATGTAQGNPDAATLTVAQFVEDLHFVLQTVRAHSTVKKMFLLAPSWGGTLGAAYLIAHNDELVDGWIDVDGNHDWTKNWDFTLEFVRSKAQEKVDAGDDKFRGVPEWAEAQKGTTMTVSALDQWAQYCSSLDCYVHDPRKLAISVGADLLLLSPFSLAAQMINQPLVQPRILANSALDHSLDLSTHMGAITVPTLIQWGRYDGVVPIAMAQDAYDHLGTSPSDKSIIVFEESGHTPPFEEPEKFVTTIVDFVERYR